jgi:hypothetical protein
VNGLSLRRIAARVERSLGDGGQVDVAEFPATALLHRSSRLLEAAVGVP